MKTKTDFSWIIKIVIFSIVISIVFTFLSAEALEGAGYILAFGVLLIFILLGIVFDIIGVAVTSASEVPFHSMASHNERGAIEALRLLRSADKVASMCNDVVGDISGIVSGTTSAIIVANLARDISINNLLLQLLVSGLVAGLTIGGKALGKAAAINNNTKIVLTTGKILSFKNRILRRK